jgi:hypothetical protein
MKRTVSRTECLLAELAPSPVPVSRDAHPGDFADLPPEVRRLCGACHREREGA